MQHLILQTQQYNLYVHRMGQWLQTLGYGSTTVRNMPSMLKEFFYYCESKAVLQTTAITADIIKGYIEYIKTRKNNRTDGALSTSHINSHIRMLHQFSDYLRQTEQININIPVQHIPEDKKTGHVILTIEEIKQLWQVTDETPYGMRDRAMLAVYYSCGLRKGEGVDLDVSDILFERKLLYIRKAKNNYERYVPITKNNLQWLEQWICNGRNLMLPEHSKDTALFISERGRRISSCMMYVRLKMLQQKSGIQKVIGLHTLRHSIATHLLQKGMALENIALLLGHRSLDSTQIYTHILNETL